MTCQYCQKALFGDALTNGNAARTHDVSQILAHIATTKWLEDLTDAVVAAWPQRSKRYSKAAVLMLTWENGDITNQTLEFVRLEKVFRSEFNYEVHTWQIPLKRSGSRLTMRVQDFIDKYHGSDNLLIIYYAGHARRSDQAGAYPVWFSRYVESNLFCEGSYTIEADQRPLCHLSRYDRICAFSRLTDVFDSQKESVHAEADTASISSLLSEGDADAPDVLTLYDCCHPLCTLHGTSQASNAVLESLCAGGFETKVPWPGPNSFTSALVEELADVARSKQPVSVPELHKKVIRRLEVYQERARWNPDGSRHRSENGDPTFTKNDRRTPVYVSLTTHRPIRTIMLTPLRTDRLDNQIQHDEFPRSKDQEKPAARDTPTVLLVVRVTEDEVSAREDIRNWLLNSPPGVVEFKGFYQSYSTLLLVEVAMEVWDLLPSCPAVTFAGFVNYTDPITSPNDAPTLARQDPESLSLKMLRHRLQDDIGTIPSRNPRPDQESFAQLVSYANTVSYKQLSEWKRLHFRKNIETSLSTSLFVQFCEPLVKDKSISPDIKKCLLVHADFIAEYLSARESIEDKIASVQVQLRPRNKALPIPRIEVSTADSGAPEELGPSSSGKEPVSPGDLESKHTIPRRSSLIDSTPLASTPVASTPLASTPFASTPSAPIPWGAMASNPLAYAESRNITQEPLYSVTLGHPTFTQASKSTSNPPNLPYSMVPGHRAETEPRIFATNSSLLTPYYMENLNVSSSRPASSSRVETEFMSDSGPTKSQKRRRWRNIKQGLGLIGQGLQPRRSG